MTELLPCPFCSSGWLYETRRNGYCNDTPVMFCNSCKAVVTWEQVEEEGVNDETKAFVREHWNTRVDYRGYEQAAIDAWKCVKAYQERTCHLFKRASFGFRDGIEFGIWECSECGENIEPKDGWNYCPNCGARVRSE